MTGTRRTARLNHLELARQVVAFALERGMKPGEHLPEEALSRSFGISRTPIRSALRLLEEKGIVVKRAEEGYFLALGPQEGLAEAQTRIGDEEQTLPERILADRAARRIGDLQSVSALVRRYATSRHSVLNALKILSTDGFITQLPGRAWAFQPLLDTPRAIAESFAFRLMAEPQAILAPGFQLDAPRAGALRPQMRDFAEAPESRLAAVSFRRLDHDFHMLIAESSGNRFLSGALIAHHRLRRLAQKDAPPPPFRMRQAMGEHLDILDSLERSQPELAADQMVLHLRRSGIRRPEAAGRGAPIRRGGPA
ncbi:GntR family transcriptional regulator [Pseudogemmobacter bohemicus]|uniref:GntR family transcriptional regulator n=1 Tax=Pseudogemmobacter bohemicus TaxID=2250708 RepID=UPI000DD36A3A|nr:GntR family transcriptional regulator [Pseudogemmobacter bohemicus]